MKFQQVACVAGSLVAVLIAIGCSKTASRGISASTDAATGRVQVDGVAELWPISVVENTEKNLKADIDVLSRVSARLSSEERSRSIPLVEKISDQNQTIINYMKARTVSHLALISDSRSTYQDRDRASREFNKNIADFNREILGPRALATELIRSLEVLPPSDRIRVWPQIMEQLDRVNQGMQKLRQSEVDDARARSRDSITLARTAFDRYVSETGRRGWDSRINDLERMSTDAENAAARGEIADALRLFDRTTSSADETTQNLDKLWIAAGRAKLFRDTARRSIDEVEVASANSVEIERLEMARRDSKRAEGLINDGAFTDATLLVS